ncbi:MAG: hypothetical protein OEZ57_10075 [Nitrospirota bacterium]|nr:hypothetical protein [Nitrospirota bacterium]MDH5586083.1 hypothetical protein [Nitrospirota bacterium]MDH5775246.1 hypothetical protein [Nitrospirota bacterium]
MSEPDVSIPSSFVEIFMRERRNIEKALETTNRNIYGIGGAAELLGLKPTTLLSRIKKIE